MRKDITETSQKNGEISNRRGGFFSPWVNDYWEPSRWMDNFFNSDLSVFPSDNHLLSLAMDVDETSDEYLVSTDLPGVSAENITIDCSSNQLTITAERKNEVSEKKKQGRRERFFGTYQRSFSLPIGVDTSKISADFDAGVLTIRIPKGESVKSKRIQINTQAAVKETKH